VEENLLRIIDIGLKREHLVVGRKQRKVCPTRDANKVEVQSIEDEYMEAPMKKVQSADITLSTEDILLGRKKHT